MLALAFGLLLGVASRVEEITPGLSIGLSSDSSWVALPWLVGLGVGTLPAAAVRGVVAVTAANAGYYGWVALTEPGVRLATVAAAPPAHWLLLGLAAGTLFGGAGALARRAPFPGALPLAAVLIWKGTSGAAGDLPGLALGSVLLGASGLLQLGVDRPTSG